MDADLHTGSLLGSTLTNKNKNKTPVRQLELQDSRRKKAEIQYQQMPHLIPPGAQKPRWLFRGMPD